jgi:enolase
MSDSSIHTIVSREILDSRGNPTLETTVILASGYRGTTSVPSGASVGKYEALELRDHDEKRYNGMGVTKAVSIINTIIAPKLKGIDVFNQENIDKIMISLDGTPDKKRLGANSIISVSSAACAAAAHLKNIPLYIYLHSLIPEIQNDKIQRIPAPIFNVINGGRHGGGNVDFQEYFLIPASNYSFSDALRIGVELYQNVKKLLIAKGLVHAVGDEGGFAPNVSTNMDPIEILYEVIRTSPYRFGRDVFFGLDIAASTLIGERGYSIKDRPVPYQTNEFITYLKNLHALYRLLILEDPFGEDDWDGWTKINNELGTEILIVGDDLLTTNPERLTMAIQKKACGGILLKPNQIGTISEFIEVVSVAKNNSEKCIVSHRSGETNDTFIADMAVAVQAEYVKFGAPARGERVTKYNRLLEIEKELMKSN